MPIHNYDGLMFVGREDIAEQIITLALDPKAFEQRRRSILIEGPSNRGKSWLLCRVCELLDRQQPRQSIPCLISIADPFNNDTLEYIAKLWIVAHPHISHLFWPQIVSSATSFHQQLSELSTYFR